MLKNLFPLVLLALSAPTLTWAQAPWITATTPPWMAVPTQPRITNNLLVPAPGVVWGQNFENQNVGNFQNYVFATQDGGQTWQTDYLGGGNSDPAGRGFLIADTWALSGTAAWVLLQNAQTRQSQLLRTTTGIGGFSAVPAPAATFIRFVRFFDATTGVLIRWDPNQSDKQVYRTTDGGATWQGPQLLPGPNNDQVLSCIRLGDHLWLSTRLGWVLHSADRGNTWAAATIAPGITLQTISFRDSQHGLAVAGQAVLRTADGGATWALLPSTGPVHHATLGAVPGSAGTYLSGGQAGSNDQVGSSISTDDGVTWQSLENRVAHAQLAVASDGQAWTAAPATGTLSRYGGAALRTTAPRWQSLRLCPNPTTGSVQLPAAAQLRELTLYDATGRQQRQEQLRPGAAQLDLRTLAPGLYQVIARAADGTVYTDRLLKE